jgi:transcription elongation factor Elf1
MGDSVYTTQWNVAVMTPPSKFLEYLNKCSVEGIVQKANKFTFRCPLCGDSEKSSSKRRGFLLTKMDGNAAMGCHNCGHRGSFKDYLKNEKPIIYSQWVKDVFIGISLNINR